MIENQTVELFSVNVSSDSVAASARDLFVQHGFRTIRSFDLQLARAGQAQCSCPHHGMESCDCQLVVLLIYGIQNRPVTLVCHGYDGWSHLALVDIPGQTISPESMMLILKILSPVQLEI